MLISHRKRFIYTKTVKTAGTSVEVYFEPWCLPENTWTFSHARDQTVCADGIIGYRGNNRGDSSWWNHMPASLIAFLVQGIAASSSAATVLPDNSAVVAPESGTSFP